MPHKRAKRSIRLAETAKKGSNLPPTAAAYDDTPRSASRIINGWATQRAFRASGRTTSEDTGQRQPRKAGLSTGSTSTEGKGKGKAKASAEAGSSTPTPGKGAAKVENDNDNTKGKGKGKGKGKFDVPSILPHETLGEYNRRIESLMRPEVNKAIKDAASVKAGEEARAWKEKKERKKVAKLEKLVKEGKADKSLLEEAKARAKAVALGGGKRKREDGDDEDQSSSEGEEERGQRQGGKGKGTAQGAKTQKIQNEFAALPAPRRLNDIVQAPPSLPHLRRSGEKKTSGKGVYAAIPSGSGKDPLNAGQRRIMEEERERVVRLYRDMKERGVVGRGVEVGRGL